MNVTVGKSSTIQTPRISTSRKTHFRWRDSCCNPNFDFQKVDPIRGFHSTGDTADIISSVRIYSKITTECQHHFKRNIWRNAAPCLGPGSSPHMSFTYTCCALQWRTREANPFTPRAAPHAAEPNMRVACNEMPRASSAAAACDARNRASHLCRGAKVGWRGL